MSKPTPRTDAQEYYIDGHYHVSADLARELERTLLEILTAWDHYEQDGETAEILAVIDAAKQKFK